MKSGHVRDHPKFRPLIRDLTQNRVLAYKHSYDVFRDWIGAMHAFLFHLDHGVDEMKKELDRHTAKEGKELARMMTEYFHIVEDYQFHDVLGAIFMEIEVASVRAGQFFTPWQICLLMAELNFDRWGFDAILEENGYVTVCDPATGSGAMLLAYAHVVKKTCGPAALRKVKFYGQDVDLRCVHMARIQLRTNGLDSFGNMVRLFTEGDQYEPFPGASYTQSSRSTHRAGTTDIPPVEKSTNHGATGVVGTQDLLPFDQD